MAAGAVTQLTGVLDDEWEVNWWQTLGEPIAIDKFKIAVWRSVHVDSGKTFYGPHSKGIWCQKVIFRDVVSFLEMQSLNVFKKTFRESDSF